MNKITINNTLDFDQYDAHSVASALTLGGLKDLVDELYFKYGGQAEFSLRANEDWGDWYVSQSITTSRPETDEEYAERILEEDIKGKQERAIREAQYLKLKAEFEGSALAEIVEKYKDSSPLPFSGFDPVELMDKQK